MKVFFKSFQREYTMQIKALAATLSSQFNSVSYIEIKILANLLSDPS